MGRTIDKEVEDEHQQCFSYSGGHDTGAAHHRQRLCGGLEGGDGRRATAGLAPLHSTTATLRRRAPAEEPSTSRPDAVRGASVALPQRGARDTSLQCRPAAQPVSRREGCGCRPAAGRAGQRRTAPLPGEMAWRARVAQPPIRSRPRRWRGRLLLVLGPLRIAPLLQRHSKRRGGSFGIRHSTRRRQSGRPAPRMQLNDPAYRRTRPAIGDWRDPGAPEGPDRRDRICPGAEASSGAKSVPGLPLLRGCRSDGDRRAALPGTRPHQLAAEAGRPVSARSGSAVPWQTPRGRRRSRGAGRCFAAARRGPAARGTLRSLRSRTDPVR